MMCRLMVELEQRSPLKRWIKFQNYQLARLEELERERDGLKKGLTESLQPTIRMPQRKFSSMLSRI